MAMPCCMYTYSKSTGFGTLNMLSFVGGTWFTGWFRFNRVQHTAALVMHEEIFQAIHEYTFFRVRYSQFPVPEYNFTIVPTADSSLAFRDVASST
ncbi:hypothetical protein [Peribacillus butanolivorans]|uniref:hypothetical protein n=2 Tax=Peribacillus butanolivorans TaxID=421767 RepID=UPI00268C996E